MVITAKSRIDELKKIATDFSKYLCEISGTQLSANIRLGIAICARDALLHCKGCQEYIKKNNNGKDSSIFKFQQYCTHEIHHTPPFPTPLTPSAASTSTITFEQNKCLVGIVHALICHQSSLNDDWYDDTIQAMMDCTLLPSPKDSTSSKTTIAQYHSALMEIILVASMSHGLHIAFLILNNTTEDIRDIPSLPTFQDLQYAPAPSCINFDKLLKQGRSLRQYDWISHAPFILHQDINPTSIEYQKLTTKASEEVPNFYILLPFLPFVSVLLAYEDAYMVSQIMHILYLNVFEVILPFLHLNSNQKCTSSISRYELEFIAQTVAESYGCDY